MSGWQMAEPLSVLTRDTLVALGCSCGLWAAWLGQGGGTLPGESGTEGPGRLLTHTSGP